VSITQGRWVRNSSVASIGVVVLELATAEHLGERGKGIVTSRADATIVKLVEAIS
jgi:hypothetical protein